LKIKEVESELLGAVRVNGNGDALFVRQKVKEIAQSFGFDLVDQTRILTSVSELTRNICKYAGKGEVIFQMVYQGDKKGLRIIFQDEGPGISDTKIAMRKGYSTSGGLGIGLLMAKQLMDEFDIESQVGRGTRVTVVKWL